MTGIFDIEELKQFKINTPIVDRISTNGAYGHMYHLKKYVGIAENTRMMCGIEHGFYPYTGAFIHEILYHSDALLTWSSYRKNILERIFGKNAIPIGPYINYVEGLYSHDKVKEIKRKNGRTLLVLPSHSVATESSSYDFNEWLEFLCDIAKGFSKIYISLPYFDLMEEKASRYNMMNSEIVSSGCIEDIDFLSRMKTIIELSDAVCANEFTTGLLYSLFLGKPVLLHEQEIKRHTKTMPTYMPDDDNCVLNEFKEVACVHGLDNYSSQYEWGIRYAGFREIMSKDELNIILSTYAKRGVI